jgi:hypothetical protein
MLVCSTLAPLCAQISYAGSPLTVPASSDNNGDVVPNFFCDDNIGNCFDVDLPFMSDDDNINDGIIGPFDATECTSLTAQFIFSSSGNLDNGDDVFLCHRVNPNTAYSLADNNNAFFNSGADTDCGAQADDNDLNATNYNEGATIGGVDNCDADWQSVAVDITIYTGPRLPIGSTFQFRACSDFDGTDEQVTLDQFQIFGTGCAFSGFLPVELVELQAQPKADHIQLSWVTATEIDFSHYVVEHATDAKQFRPIHKAQTQSESGSLRTLFYAWMHRTPSKGDNYYRLKMVDLDGTFEYSPVVHAWWYEKGGFQVFPNSVATSFQVQGDAQQLQLIDINGKMVKQWTRTAGGESYTIAELPSGIYQLVDRSTRQSVRLVKQ